MEQFLQAYGGWIVIGLFFLFMLRLHGSGAGCGMGHDDHREPRDAGQQPPPTTDEPLGGPMPAKGRPPATREAGGCHDALTARLEREEGARS